MARHKWFEGSNLDAAGMVVAKPKPENGPLARVEQTRRARFQDFRV
jgi:hypothetical protein